MQVWRHIRAVLPLPFMVTVVIPGLILCSTGVDSLGLWDSAAVARVALSVFGAVVILSGLTLLVATIRLFASKGRGTLAPWDPPQKLVVQGVYGHVRNPMISGVFCILLGEALVSSSVPLLGWAAFFITANLIRVPRVEEPRLVKRFGAEYEEYRRNVPRWIPRARAWKSANK